MKFKVEEIFRTEGVPEYTFVMPPNYNQILVDIRNPTKPVIIEGQSGTGKTVTITKVVAEHFGSACFEYLSARKSEHLSRIYEILNDNKPGKYIIDDFHRLDKKHQEEFGNKIKISAEESDPNKNSKYVIIGINKIGSGLIHLVHDVAKRCGIHRIEPGSLDTTKDLISKGEQKLNVTIGQYEQIYAESKGDYWLTQLLCQSICLENDLLETQDGDARCVVVDMSNIRRTVTARLGNAYSEPVIEFCRGKRFRSTNDPYFKILKAVSEQENSIVDLTELANSYPEVRGSINNVKDRRLFVLLESKPICDRYFHYNNETKNFAIEDPALFYFIKHVDWVKIRRDCGFRDAGKEYEFDFAISFAGVNRDLARIISKQIEIMDCSVFFDELFENNYLGKTWHATFKDIFSEKARFVVCLLDKNHLEKIWPTFERECFEPRIVDEAVIPIFIDNTVFPGIPRDLIGIDLKNKTIEVTDDFVTDNIIFRLLEKIDNV